jgi:Na+:H+ antiporter, NhaA family
MAVRLRKLPPSIFQRFFRTETAGGSVLLLFGIAALALANSPLARPYAGIWRTSLTVGIADYSLSLTLHQWINDGLMAAFFLLVGLEIKRELVVGELASVRKAALPIACAIGGMIVPAALYWIFNPIGFGARGWGIPIATDIAFALAALALIAPHAPTGARVFLTALAIVDDVGAVLVIATFYSETIAWGALGVAGLLVLVLFGFNAIGVHRLWPYLLVGVALWYFVHQSGVHATVAGVALACAIPTRTRTNAAQFSRPVLRLEHALHKFSAFVVMPLFAFANAGVTLALPIQHAEIAIGVLVGLVLGKPLGIMAAALLAVKSGVAQLPHAVGWTSLLGYAWLAGIGFTMSLFIAMLAFDETAPVGAAKLGILAGSLAAGVAGAIVLRIASGFRNE